MVSETGVINLRLKVKRRLGFTKEVGETGGLCFDIHKNLCGKRSSPRKQSTLHVNVSYNIL